jgi:heme/copper-type cytochrome/quinol oxidase subunit 2
MGMARIVGSIAFMVAIAVAGIAIGWGITTVQTQTVTFTASSSATTSAASNSSSPYVLTLVITTENTYNSTTGTQPAFYVLGPNGLESSANIALPAHRLIKLVIICYDDGAANLTGSQYAAVSGTQNNTVSVVNNANVNSTQGAAGIQLSGGQSVSSLPADSVAHTFTIPQLGINIPVAPSSTVTAYFTINQTGSFTWFCMTLCGSGPTGLSGAMETPGWMNGHLSAS